ncbi:MAG: hypothetical protein HY077_17760 [Elusimicrobia bacterium]|nr:hypothetical protein [Elusimicrobiota bacterium]
MEFWHALGGWSGLLDAALAAALAAWVAVLLSSARDERPALLSWLGWGLLFLLCSRTTGWLLGRRFLSPDELPSAMPLSGTWESWRFSMFAGAAAFACLRRGWRSPPLGAFCGFLFAALGFCAYRWLIIASAWRLAGAFAGPLLIWSLPFWLSGSCAAVAAALLHPDLAGYRGRIMSLLFLVWFAGAIFCHWRLETGWDLGPRSLAEAAKLAPPVDARDVGVAWLKSTRTQPYAFEEKKPELAGVSISQANLVRVYEYLEAHHFRSLFARQGLNLLRQGWFFWWDAERALKASALTYPGRVVPDYRLATGLLRAGPQTRERLETLKSLSEMAKPRKAGFEDVTQSQYIFEGFSGAFARFGDEEQARWWLVKIDGLWPIYEKKIEVTPVESVHDGEVSGSVLLATAPAAGLLVGLFYVGVTTAPEASISGGTLSDSAPADAEGRFRFATLGPGRYYLGLMGETQVLRGRIHDSPGVFEITQDTPVAHLAPILIDREGPP